ncbi:hypothetical protein EI42_03489 [Thermosporothrix hazakensis]|uniref:Metal-independent alpha-mannosidase n=1 Tax=Thermosporothrix hazakensis TaxID=644383 RepID=A0A326U435_THEHA|nr:glycoside hydrolase family 125 protein [Thermosporothrix hazakensis]PZW27403.1 hypothetical protein EI42_03489 [Thermosporothrix hazakensis]GCE45570.1 glycosyl hydrolase [Thermosporothrix hazakensis]
MTHYQSVDSLIQTIRQKLEHRPHLAQMFAQCFPNTLETTVEELDDSTTFVITGDIPAMWLRDSSAQVNPYIKLANEDTNLQRMLRGVIRRQASYILKDPYANAFNREANNNGFHKADLPPAGHWVWERKFELDSLCYPVKLLYTYWKTTNDPQVCDDLVHTMLWQIIKIMKIEQEHDSRSEYRFIRNVGPATDTLPFEGKGTRTNFTGMVWSGFRPSDDACTFGYLVPANMFAVVILGYMIELANKVYHDSELALQAESLRKDIEHGIQTYGIVNHPRFGRIYAYETDGYGNYNLMDDANVPSLLSIPYLGYRPVDDPIYQNTRRFILSKENPYYFEGKLARGIGSPHTEHGFIWHIALSMQGLTSTSAEERKELLHMLETTTADTDYMHESFHPDDPSRFSRAWFAWANSLFGEFVHMMVEEHPEELF